MVVIFNLVKIALTEVVELPEDVRRVAHLSNAILVEEKQHEQAAAFGEVHFKLHYGVGDVFAG